MEEKPILDFINQMQYIWDKNQQISNLTHERFNIFSVLRKEHDEEKLHSAFLAELLNPKGGHGFADSFLVLFAEQILNKASCLQTSNAKVYRERTVEDGRIDIYVKCESNLILIENKINAVDQGLQLSRYYDHMRKNGGEQSSLLYLTLDGKPPSDVSKGLLTEDQYLCVSYGNDILSWLVSCMKEAVDVPVVRETIRQYINLVKKLTGGLVNQMLDNEITSIVKQNIEIARLIKNRFEKAHRELLNDFVQSEYENSEKVWGATWHFVSASGITLVAGVDKDRYRLCAFPNYNDPKKHSTFGYSMDHENLGARIEKFQDKSGKNWSARISYPQNCEDLRDVISEWDELWKVL